MQGRSCRLGHPIHVIVNAMKEGETNGDASHQQVVAPALFVWFERRPWLLALVLAVVTFVAYQPVWHAGFIWDDDDHLTANTAVAASNGLRMIWSSLAVSRYYPLTLTSFWIQRRLWGLNPLPYHLVNVVLHVVNAILVWITLRRLKIPGAWLAGMVFALHPVNVATVAWISEQKTILSMLFYLAAILLYLQFDDDGRWHWYGLALLLFLLALLSKTGAVCLPLVLLGCVWWKRGILLQNDLLRSVPFFLLSAFSALPTIWLENSQHEPHTIQAASFLTRLVRAGWIPWFYLGKALLPVNLTVLYPQWQVDASRWLSYVPGIILAGLFLWSWHRRGTWGRPVLFGLGYFVVTLLPVLGFFDIGFHAFSLVADHWQYYSIVGIIALVVGVADMLCRRADRWGPDLGILVSVAVLVALGMATRARAGIYTDAAILWQDNLAKNPGAWAAHYNLAVELDRGGRFQEAFDHYEQAVILNPDNVEAHVNLGSALRRMGKVDEAIQHYRRALEIIPDYPEAHNNLGNALLQTGRIQEAIGHFEEALRLRPNYAEAHNNLGDALLEVGRVPEAINQDEQALQLWPDYPEAHNNLANALLHAGRAQEAIGHYEEALRLKPDFANVHYNLAMLLANMHRTAEAVAHLETALKLEPDDKDFRNALNELQQLKAGAATH
jgi:protein O-mannosyl-transferase